LKKGRVAFFVTGNVHKFHEARCVLSEFNIATAMLNMDTVEIQADDLESVAKASALDAAQKSHMPIFVEDAGLFAKALNGFPGPYSSYTYRTLGTKGILTLMEDITQREAYFQSVIAFCDSDDQQSLRVFSGKAEGKIINSERGKQGFGFDPIFQPKAESGKTFAEMTTEEKNRYSHRAGALRKFAAWYTMF
jgi:XTP/dITP diphosphohydrolase